jgi:hypothetical protein
MLKEKLNGVFRWMTIKEYRYKYSLLANLVHIDHLSPDDYVADATS